MKIHAYLKPHCGWSQGVRAIMRKYSLDFEDLDVTAVPSNYEEMVRKSGQRMAPCVELDGVMLADVSGEELENYLLSNHLVIPSGAAPECPIDIGCRDNANPPATHTIRFF